MTEWVSESNHGVLEVLWRNWFSQLARNWILFFIIFDVIYGWSLVCYIFFQLVRYFYLAHFCWLHCGEKNQNIFRQKNSIVFLWDQNVELHANYLPPIVNCILIRRLHNPNSSLGKIRSPIVFLRVPSPPFYLQRKITIGSKWPK